MSMSSINDTQQFIALDQIAERRAITVLRGVTFIDCLKMCGLAPMLTVQTPEGKTITIRGSDVYDSRTWAKFLSNTHQAEDLYQLTEVGANLAKQYKQWLLTEYTQRYRALSTTNELTWLEQVITLAVSRHIMEQKYHVYMTKGKETFADPRTAIEIGNILTLNRMTKEASRLIHHIIKEPTQAKHLIEQFYEEHFHQMEARSLLMNARLPPSAQEMTVSFLLPTLKEETHDE